MWDWQQDDGRYGSVVLGDWSAILIICVDVSHPIRRPTVAYLDVSKEQLRLEKDAVRTYTNHTGVRGRI